MPSRLPQMDLIAELKKRQVSPLVREGKDGAIEDIITGTNRLTERGGSSRLYQSSVVDVKTAQMDVTVKERSRSSIPSHNIVMTGRPFS